MRINVAVPEAHVTKPILDATLEGVTRLNEALIESRAVPTFREAVEQVRWRPEPPGQEHFDHAGIVLGRGHGDCDDLAPWHAASLRATGEDPQAMAVVRKSGPKRWHAVVRRGDGSIDDPSKEAGMGQRSGVNGAALPVMSGSAIVGAFQMRPQLAVRPIVDPGSADIEAWEARADLPWHWSPGSSPGDIAMASLHRSPVASQAVVGAIRGAVRLGEESEYVDEETLDRAQAVSDALEGADYWELAGEYGEDIADDTVVVVGSIFKKIGKGLKKFGQGIVKVATSKFGRGLISMVPGVGPVASTALDVASPALNKLVADKHKHKSRRRGGGGGRIVMPSFQPQIVVPRAASKVRIITPAEYRAMGGQGLPFITG